MEDIIANLRFNINDYIVKKTLEYNNSEMDEIISNIGLNMYNYENNIELMTDKQLLNNEEYKSIQNLLHVFEKIKIFLQECDTKIYIGYESMFVYFKSLNSRDCKNYITIYTNRNFIINVTIEHLHLANGNNEYVANCCETSTHKDNDDIKLNFYIRIHKYDNTTITNENIQQYIFTKRDNYSSNNIDNIDKYKKIIINIMKNTNIHYLYLDYLLLHDNNVSREFIKY